MKRILLVLVVVLCAASVSAQSKFESTVKAIADQKWSVGLRVGSGLRADAECFYGEKTYVEGRFGMAWLGGLGADFTALHNWNCCNWDWTPSVGNWFLDAGVGFNIGGGAKTWARVVYSGEYDLGEGIVGGTYGTTIYGGVAGQVKFGIKFNEVPIRLAIDWTPVFGVSGAYATAKGKKEIKAANDELKAANIDGRFKVKDAHFYSMGLANIAISATYCF